MFVRKLLRLLGVVVRVAVVFLDWKSFAAQVVWVLESDHNGDLYGLKYLLPEVDLLDKARQIPPSDSIEVFQEESNDHSEVIQEEPGTPSEELQETIFEPNEQEAPGSPIKASQSPSEEPSESYQEEPDLIGKFKLFIQRHSNPAEKRPESRVVRAISSCGNNRRWVALTFDDGPNVEYTDQIREELGSLGVPATFFLSPEASGQDQKSLCRQARSLVAAGHELQLHSMTHPHLPGLNQAKFDKEVQGGIDWMKKCGLPRPNMFRPPFGELKPHQARYLHERYNLIVAQWNVESSDHDANLTQDDIFRNIQEEFEGKIGIGNSAVILMHDLHAGSRSGIITRVVNYFQQLNYKFVTMNQCYNVCKRPVCKGNGGPTLYKDVYIP